MTDEAEATAEIAKTVGKGIDAAREAGGFIAKYVAGPLEQGIGIFEDKLKYLRWKNQVRLMNRADEFLQAQGLSAPTRPVPLKLAIPLLQEGSLEDDPYMQDHWAQMLANAANSQSGVEVSRSYIDILSQLNPLEIRILDTVYSLPGLYMRTSVVTKDLPEKASLHSGSPNDIPSEPSIDVSLALANLDRLGCIRSAGWGPEQSYRLINTTILGKAFVEACRPRVD